MAENVRAAAKPRTPNEAPSDSPANEPGGDAAQAHAQKVMDEGNAKGYLGEQPHEPHAPEAYTLEGGAPEVDIVNPVPRREPVDRTAAEQNRA
jgi:hypothetical protein